MKTIPNQLKLAVMAGLILTFGLVAFSPNPPLPPATTVVNGAQITLANSSELEINFNSLASSPYRITAYVNIISSASGVQVGSGETIVAAHYAWPTGSKVPISFANSYSTLRFKGTNGDVIVVTY